MQIIPAIDLIEGKCVRLTQGDYRQQKTYHDHPVYMAKQFEDAGLSRLHLVDLDGARQGKVVNWAVLEQMAVQTSLQIDFGGGIHQESDLQRIFSSGARWASVGSMAVRKPELFAQWVMQFGGDHILLGADVRNNQVAISGWVQDSGIALMDFLDRQTALGIQQIFCTDISKDGLLQGPSIDLYTSILKRYPALKLIASGGVSCVKDLKELRALGCSGAIVGKAIYEGKISLHELASFMQENELDAAN